MRISKTISALAMAGLLGVAACGGGEGEEGAGADAGLEATGGADAGMGATTAPDPGMPAGMGTPMDTGMGGAGMGGTGAGMGADTMTRR